MEVVHVVRQYAPSVGGLEEAVSNLCAHLSRKKALTVRVVTLDRWFVRPDRTLPRREVIDGIEVTRIPYTGSSRYPIAPSVLSEIRSADLVHVHAIDFFFDYLAMTAWLHRKPLVASTHGGFFHTKFASGLKQIYFRTATRLSAQAYAALCCSSDNDAETFRRIAPTKTVTIENGVNVEKWSGCAASKLSPTLLFIGRWAKNKRLPLLIQLLAALKDKGQSWNLIVAGLPGDETEATLTRLSQLAGVADQVTWVPSPKDREIATLISRSSYIVSASAYEGFGISLIEGLSAGLLPVTTAIPTFEKVRRALGFGVVLQPESLSTTADDLLRFHAEALGDSDRLRSQCMSFAQRYTWKAAAESFHALYTGVLNRRPVASSRREPDLSERRAEPG